MIHNQPNLSFDPCPALKPARILILKLQLYAQNPAHRGVNPFFSNCAILYSLQHSPVSSFKIRRHQKHIHPGAKSLNCSLNNNTSVKIYRAKS